MTKITQIRTKEDTNKFVMHIAESEGIYYFHMSRQDYDNLKTSVSMVVSKQQMKKLCADIQKYINMKDNMEDFVPTEQQIVDTFERRYTGSGKLRCIQNILNNDPTVKEWIKNWLNDEPLQG